MKRFLVTSPAWNGTAELHFDDQDLLCKIDMMETVMPLPIIRIFKEKAPCHVSELEAAFKGTHATVVEAEYEVTFDMFWKAYNKKINRVRALKLWDKMEKSMQVRAYFGVRAYDRYLKTKAEWRSKADPETYLRNEYWENEY